MAAMLRKARKGNLAFMSKTRRVKKNSFDSLFRPNNDEERYESVLFDIGRLCQNNLYMYGINKLLHGWLVCTIFTMHLLWKIAKLTRSPPLCSPTMQ